MEALVFLVPMALVVIAVATGIFIWSLKRGQFEDMQGPAHRIIIDDRESQARLDDKAADEKAVGEKPSGETGTGNDTGHHDKSNTPPQ